MKTYERLAKNYSREQLYEMIVSVGIAMDHRLCTGLRLAAARKRWWTLQKAIDLKYVRTTK
jgi:hypothetical protein